MSNKEKELIKKLEKEIGKKLSQIPFDEIEVINKGYSLDENGKVIGLNLRGFELDRLPDYLSEFRHMTTLELYRNRLTDLSGLQALRNLTSLNLAASQLVDISDLQTLSNLTSLDLGYNIKLTDISGLQGLTNLTSLNLSSNQITDLSGLQALSNLTLLNLNSNQLTDISALQGLSNLTYLHLAGYQLTDISALQGLTNLTTLYLNGNQLTDISALQGLSNLTKLYLNYNQLIDISGLQGLSNLTKLDLQYNKIKELPEWIVDMGMEIDVDSDSKRPDYIHLSSNPLENPPLEIVKQGRKAIKDYFKSLKEGETKALKEVKVLLVGEGAVGKTSLAKRMMGKDFDKKEAQTDGLNIYKWSVPDNDGESNIRVNLWDFGGQEIMHATHQFFLSKRSFYILVLDGRRDERTEYWLNHIKSFGGDSPVLVVINKIDENPGFEVNRKFLMDKYTNIKGFCRVSCSTGEGIDTFSQNLIRELAKVELINTIWAQSWFKVKKKLENMKKDFISYDDYVKMCEKENIHDEESEHTLVEFLNDLGVILHFDDPSLKETNVINPEWATQAVYDIINSPILANNKGILEQDSLKQILDKGNYPRQKHDFIIELMKKFELCFSLREDTILVPDLLAVEEPPFDFDYASAFKFLIQYDFLPKSVISRFIVRMHRDIKDKLRWRTGVVLIDPLFECTTTVKVDEKEKQMQVFVTGTQKREYFPIIRKMLLDINSSYEKMDAKEMVPCNCRQCATSLTPYYFDYSYLIKCLKNRKPTVNCQKSVEDVPLDQLLSGIEIEREDTRYIWNVFISYSSKDRPIIETIIGDLNNNRITYWWDKEKLLAGDLVLQTIEKGLQGSRFVLACFSRNQLESGWCHAEYETILSEVFSGGTDQKVLPLILDDLTHKELPQFIRGLKYEKYSNTDGYRNILKRLKKPFTSS